MKVLSVAVAPYEGGKYYVINVDDVEVKSFVLRFAEEVITTLDLIDSLKAMVIKTVCSTLPPKLVAEAVLPILVGSDIEIKQTEKTNGYGKFIITKIISIKNVDDAAITKVATSLKVLLDPMAALTTL